MQQEPRMKDMKQDGKSILADCQTNYKSSLVSKNKVDSTIRSWIKSYKGDAYGNEVKGRSSLVMKDVKKAIKAMSPSIVEPFMASQTMVQAKPVRVGMEAEANYESDILNYQFNNQFDKLEFFTSLSNILPKEGTIFVRTGWDFKEEVKRKTMKGVSDQDVAALQQVSGDQVKDIKGNKNGSYDVTIVKRVTTINNPTAKICKNESITTDPTAESFKESKFITYEYEKSISDVRKEKNIYDYQEITDALIAQATTSRYPETALGGQRAQDNYNSGVDYNFNFAEKSSKKIRIIEYWGEYDIDGTGINKQIVCAWIKGTDFILRLDENPYPDNAIPFVSCQFGFEPFTLWGNGVADSIGENQQIHTAIMRGFIDNMSLSNNGQKFFQKGAIDYVNMGKLARGEKYIEMNSIEGFKDGSYNQLPPSSVQVYDMISADTDLLTGTSKNMDGIDQATIGRTAAGVNQVMSAAQRHMILIVRTISEMMKDLFSKWSSYNSVFLDKEQAFEIAGTLVPIDKSKVTGNIRIELNVNVDSMNTQKIQQINMLLQQSEQLQGQVPPNVVPMLIAEIFEGFGKYEEAKAIREYKPAPDPVQQQMQQLELALKQAEVEKIKAQTQLLISQSKSAEESATKASSAAIKHQAEADNIDMSTINMQKESLLKEAEFRHNATEDFLARQTKSVKS
jgi:hypothetical protein